MNNYIKVMKKIEEKMAEKFFVWDILRIPRRLDISKLKTCYI